MVSGTSHAPTRPISWYCGNQETFESVSVTPSRVRINAQFARTCVTPTTTPLGAPVDPDVNCTNATFARDASSASSSFFSSSFFSSRVFSRRFAPRARDAFQRHERERNVFRKWRAAVFRKTTARRVRVRWCVTRRTRRATTRAANEANEAVSFRFASASPNAAAYDADVNATRAPHAAATLKSAARSSANRGAAADGSGGRAGTATTEHAWHARNATRKSSPGGTPARPRLGERRGHDAVERGLPSTATREHPSLAAARAGRPAREPRGARARARPGARALVSSSPRGRRTRTRETTRRRRGCRSCHARRPSRGVQSGGQARDCASEEATPSREGMASTAGGGSRRAREGEARRVLVPRTLRRFSFFDPPRIHHAVPIACRAVIG